MARYLVIDWDQQQLRVVEATVQNGKAKLRQARSWSEGLTLNEPNAQAAGLKLKQRLEEAGIAPGPVIFAVAREQVIFRDIRYPDVPAEEVAAVVRFQAIKEIHFPPDDAIIDFTPSSVSWPTGEKRALAAVLHKLMLSAVHKMCQAAGLRLEAVCPRSFGIPLASGGHKSPGNSQPTAILLKSETTGEVCVARGEELLFSRAFTLSDSVAKDAGMSPFIPEVRRSLAAYASQFPQQAVGALLVAAKKEETIDPAWEARLRLPARTFDPLPELDASTADASAFASMLGLIQLKAAQNNLTVDFLATKQPPPPDTSKRRYAMIAAAAVLLVLLLGGGVYTMASMSKDSEIHQLQAQSAALKKNIEAYGDLEKRLEGVDRWDSGEMVVLDELYDLIARFPDVAGLVINKLRWEPVAPEARGTAVRAPSNSKTASKNNTVKPVGRLTIEAASDSNDALEKLRQAFDNDPHWKPEAWQPDTPGPKQATLTLKVFAQEAREYQAVLGPTTNVTSSERKIDNTRNRFGRPRFQPRGGRP